MRQSKTILYIHTYMYFIYYIYIYNIHVHMSLVIKISIEICTITGNQCGNQRVNNSFETTHTHDTKKQQLIPNSEYLK